MSAPELMEDDEAALTRLLGTDTVATPASLNAGLRWLLSKLRQELDARPAPVGQEWGTLGQVMQIYGKKKSAACEMLNRLREHGKVRVCVPPTGRSGKGDTLYNLQDIEAACMENARRVEKAGKMEAAPMESDPNDIPF